MELLIVQDVQEVLETCEIRSCRGNGPYATKKVGSALNGPLGRHSCLEKSYVNFIRTDEEWSSVSRALIQLILCRSKTRSLLQNQESRRLLDGHYEIATSWKLHPPVYKLTGH